MELNSQTQLYAILGDPVEHSLSPQIHNAAFQHFRVNAAYAAFRVGQDELGLAFEGIRSLGIRGVNLTIPLKQKAFEYIDEIPEDVDRKTGAINTVVNKDGMLYGYNTDGPGFLTSLNEDLSFDPEGRTALLLGAGGAACGVAFSLARAHAERVIIWNRTAERAQALADFASPHFPETEIYAPESLDEIYSQKVDLVVNSTSCGMKGNAEVPMDLKKLKSKAAVLDLVYAPLETPFLKTAKALGLKQANGLGMLAAQAALSFELWTGKKDGVRELMRETLKKCLA